MDAREVERLGDDLAEFTGEGRTWQGWNHHGTLVSAAHAFCTLQRLDPKGPAPA